MALWQVLSFFPGLGAFFGVSVVVAGSVKNGNLFTGGFMVAMG